MTGRKEKAQIRLTRPSTAYWRVTFDNPPLNGMGAQFVRELREIITAVEGDKEVKVLVFESAVEGFFLNHSDFLANLKDLTSLPQGPTGLEACTRRPFHQQIRSAHHEPHRKNIHDGADPARAAPAVLLARDTPYSAAQHFRTQG